MSTITIDGKDFDYEALSDEVKSNLLSMQFCDNELQRLDAHAAALQTARAAYARVVSEKLNDNSPSNAAIVDDMIKFA